MRQPYHRTIAVVMLWLVGAICLLPTAFVVLAGFFGDIAVARWQTPNIDGFIQLWHDREARTAITQSFLLAITSSVVAVLLVFLHQSVSLLSRRYGDRAFEASCFLTVSFPDIVWALGFMILIRWGFLHAGMALVFFVHVTFNLALAYLVVRPSLLAIPEERIQAAVDLGAPVSIIVRRVIAPEARPALFGAFVLCLVYSFDDFVLTFLLGGTEVKTIPLYLYGKLRFGATPEVLALASLAALLGIVGGVLALVISDKPVAVLAKELGEE